MGKKHIFYEIITILLFIPIFITAPTGANHIIIWLCLLVFYYYFIQSIRKPICIVPGIETYFKMDLLFLLFYYLLLYYPYQTYVMGSNSIKENSWVSQSYFEYSNKAIIASTIGLISFMIGFNKNLEIRKTTQIRDYSQKQYKRLYGQIMIITVGLFILFYINGGTIILSGSYRGTSTKNASVDGIYTLLSVFISMLAGYTILFYRKYNKINLLIFIFVVIFFTYLYITLVSGDRNTMFIVLISFAGAFYTYLKSINRKTLILYAVLAMGLYQVIEISRMAKDRSLSTIIEVATSKSKIKATSKLGANIDEGSFSITNLVTRSAFHFVPEKHDYFLGRFKMIGIAGFIPYARGFILDPNDPDQSSAGFITRVNGSGFGLGSSIIMDSYIELGILGVFLFLYLLGLLGNYIQRRAMDNNDSIKWGVIYLLSLGTFAEIPRYTFDFIVKNIGWSLLIFVIFEFFVKPKRNYTPKEELSVVN